MKSLLFILTGLVISYHYTDLEAESGVFSVVAPLGVVLFIISFFCWLVLKIHGKGIDPRTGKMKNISTQRFDDLDGSGGCDGAGE